VKPQTLAALRFFVAWRIFASTKSERDLSMWTGTHLTNRMVEPIPDCEIVRTGPSLSPLRTARSESTKGMQHHV